jgi:HAD superfamily hydrolase (TIGR01509 family)
VITTVICDLDGLLADTEKLHIRAYQETLAGYGIALEAKEYAEHWIRRGLGIADYVKRCRLSLDPDKARAQKAVRYRELVESLARPMPGAIAFLNRVRPAKQLALASSSKAGDIEAVMRRLGIAAHFEAVVSSNDVLRSKPAPDLFICAAIRLGEPASNCIVLEDAQKGVEAAVAAGMKCIAVPNEYTRHDDFSKAAIVVPTLANVTIELIDSLA